jgi:hypothetical protein
MPIPSLSPRIDNIDKNYIQNGGMDFFQRSHNLLLTTSNVYATADRFQQYIAGAWTTAPTSSRSTSVPNKLSKYSLAHVGMATDGTATSTISQFMESIMVQELSSQLASFGMWVSSDTNGPNSVTITVEVPTAVDTFTTTTVFTTVVAPITQAGGWQFISIPGMTFPDVSNGLAIRAVFSGWVAASTGTLLTTQWCLNEGPLAGNFVRHGRNYAGELAACQRYYEKSYDTDTDPGTVTSNGAQGTRLSANPQFDPNATYKVTKFSPGNPFIWSPSTGAQGFCALIDAPGGDFAPGLESSGMSGAAWNGASSSSGKYYAWQWTVDSDLN